MASGVPLGSRNLANIQNPFFYGGPIQDYPGGAEVAGRTAEEEMARQKLAQEGYKLDNLEAFYAGKPSPTGAPAPGKINLPEMSAEAKQQAQAQATAHLNEQRRIVAEAEKEFFKIANAIDKMPNLQYEGKTVPTPRGPGEEARRAEQKVAIYDQSARARAAGRRGSTLQASRGGGGGGSSSAVTGLRASSFRKTILGSD